MVLTGDVIFQRRGLRAAVVNQPSTQEELYATYQAIKACPVGAIQERKGAIEISNDNVAHQLESTAFTENPKYERTAFPAPISEIYLPGVYYSGYHSIKSMGAFSYFIKRGAGNVLIDSPRYDDGYVDLPLYY